MKLVHKDTGNEVKVGDTVTSFRGDETTVRYFAEPHKPSSQGKLTVASGFEYYVGVYGLQWIDRGDR